MFEYGWKSTLHCLALLLASSLAAAETELRFVASPEGSTAETTRAFIAQFKPRRAELEKVRDALFAKVKPDERSRLLARYKAIAGRYAPGWLEEQQAISAALGWGADDYTLFNLLHGDQLAATSWIITPDAAADKKMILHQNRDSSGDQLAANFRHRAERFRWFGIGDRWSYAPRFAVNEKGFAAAMSAGERNSVKRPEVGFNAPDTLLLMAEHCGSVDEALVLLKVLIDGNDYGDEGTIYLFIDPLKAVIVECVPGRMVTAPVDFAFEPRTTYWELPGMASFSERDVNSIMIEERREYFVRKSLQQYQKSGGIDLAEIRKLSRARNGGLFGGLEPVCREGTISGATIIPDAEFPAELTTVYLALGPVRNTVYLPLPLAVTKLPAPFFDGDWGRAGFARRDRDGLDADNLGPVEALEKELDTTYNLAVTEARALLRQGKTAEARSKLQRNFETQAAAVWKFLNPDADATK